MPPETLAAPPCLKIRFGAGDIPGLGVAVPVLDGDALEALFPLAREAGHSGDFALFRHERWLLGRASLPAGAQLEAHARRLYDGLLHLTHGHALVRVWNYVPAINEASVSGLENYRAFCRGRSLAFEGQFGTAFKRHAPAASAVGCEGDTLAVVFAAHAGPAQHVENPRQVPAYDYPSEHGPRAPVFARASVVDLGEEMSAVFISGTAAICGHVTVAPGETMAQLECTLDNLREISRSCGLGADLAAGRAAARYFKVYLRHAADLAPVQARLEATLVRPEDCVVYLRSDICRRELNVEIEASLPLVRLG